MDLDDAHEPTLTHCSRCGAPAAEGANFCSRCGHSLRGSAVPVLADDVLGESPATVSFAEAGTLAAPAYAGAYGHAATTSRFLAADAPVRYGGFWRRLWAATIDGILIWFVTALVQLAMKVNVLSPDYGQWPDRIAAAAGLLFSWLYGALLMSSRAQGTLAQQVFDLRMTDLMGRRISFLRATARHFAEYGSALLLFMGYLPILFHERRQALHDLIAGTLVVRGSVDE